MQDLAEPDPWGQVSLALSRHKYLARWGQHYLPSLHGAHVRQAYNTFKDPGPLQYDTGLPLFTRCRDVLSSAFDDLPAPTPSNIAPAHSSYAAPTAAGGRASSFRARSGLSLRGISMRSYNSSSAPCFTGWTAVHLAGRKRAQISSLRRGDSVATLVRPQRVTALLMTPMHRLVMVQLQGVLVTPWHPVALPAAAIDSAAGQAIANRWILPAQVQRRGTVRYTGAIYSVLLESDEDVDAHAIALNGRSDQAVPF
ncbi:hypothetical protein FJTKL_07426 [Diaporthe vaccinii]|uniref:Hint domain-containing protein n=1 Tax=Diaporthe vaccinii TaxID=105482 RepID=A0ABR4EU16_9PEZI